MTITRNLLHLVAVSIGLLLMPAAAKPAAAAESAPPAVLDAFSKTSLDRWAELEHRPSRLGLTGGSVELIFEGKARGRPLQAKATYSWDSSKPEPTSTLTWEPASVGRQLSREGWSRDILDHVFVSTDDIEGFSGCSLTGSTENGQVVVSVEGNAPSGIRRMTFDSKGLLAKTDFEMNQGGFAMKFSLETKYRKHKERYVMATETFRMNMGGEVVSESIHTFAEVDGVLLPSKVEEKSTWNGRPSGEKTVTWSNWKIQKKATQHP